MPKKLLCFQITVFCFFSMLTDLRAQNHDDFMSQKYEIKKNIDKFSDEKNVKLTPGAKDMIIKEILSNKIYLDSNLNTGLKSSLTPDKNASGESEKIINIISSSAPKGDINENITKFAIESNKKQEQIEVIPSKIKFISKDKGFILTDETEKYLYNDLKDQVELGVNSGLSEKEIEFRTAEFITSIVSATKANMNHSDKNTIGLTAYKRAKSIIFKKIIRLTIKSIPPKAELFTYGKKIGETTIKEKPFESDKAYTFIFRKQGYKDSAREYYVSPYIDLQECTEILVKE